MKFSEYKYIRPNINDLIEKINVLISSLNQEKDIHNLKKIVDEFFKITEDYNTNETLVSIRHSINLNDQYYNDEYKYIMEESPKLYSKFTDFKKALLSHFLAKELENIYGSYYFKILRLNEKTFSEDIIEDRILENKLVDEYDTLIANAKIDYEGNIYNLSQMKKFTTSKDRNVRFLANLAIDNFFKENEDRIDDIYDQLVKVRNKMALKLGYKNYIEYQYDSLLRTDYNSLDVKEYRKAIVKYIVPICKEIYAKQMERLNIKDPKYYDYSVFFIDGNPTPKGSALELVNKALDMYKALSDETYEFFKFMVSHELMDLETKPGKQAGGYCTFIDNYNSPFIFANFNGTSGDADVLTHEAGHAFMSYVASKSVNNKALIWPTLEACEIHSMSMEFFCHPYINTFFLEDTAKYKYAHLADALTFIPYGAMVDHFQHEVFLNVDMTKEERKALWHNLEEIYRPFDYEGLPTLAKGTYWYRQGHIFSSPFYYIDYTLAQVCAFQFYLADLKDHNEAFSRYVKLCKLGGTKSFLNLVKDAGLENPFLEETLAKVSNSLKEILLKMEF